MRILFLRRQHYGELAEFTDEWASELRRLELHVDVEEAGGWIPNTLSAVIDRDCASKLRSLARDYDLVHAFGYRSAWVCADAFEDREAWIYTAYDMPRTTHSSLVSRLNMAQRGLVPSRAVRNALSGAGVNVVEVHSPGISRDHLSSREPAALREQHFLPPDSKLVGMLLSETSETATPNDEGLEGLLRAWGPGFDGWNLVIGGDCPRELPEGVLRTGTVNRPEDFFAVCDVVVIPGFNLGFSRQALLAMALGKPVLARGTGALPEIIAEDVSGFLFYDEGVLRERLASVVEMELTRQVCGSAAKVRVEQLFDLDHSARRLKDIYLEISESAL